MKPSPTVLNELKGGDRRSIGRSNQVVSKVRRTPSLFPLLVEGLFHTDALVRMRAADAVEKITVERPDWLAPFKPSLIGLAARTKQQEMRWHLAQLLPRLDVPPAERRKIVAILRHYLRDRSRIVKTFAMQALADMADRDIRLGACVRRTLSRLVRMGSPAMKSRGRKLLVRLGRSKQARSATVSHD